MIAPSKVAKAVIKARMIVAMRPIMAAIITALSFDGGGAILIVCGLDMAFRCITV